MRRLLAALALVAGLTGLSACLASPPPPPPAVRYLVYGDSLSEESAPYLIYTSGPVGKRYFGGTAPCNWSGGLPADTQLWRPQQVLLQFIGNLPACMNGRNQTQAYEQDLTAIAQFWQARGVSVVMVISPITQVGDLVWAQTAELTVAANLGLTVRRADQAVLNAGAFTFFLPCSSPFEQTCGAEQPGLVRVRDPDGVHLAPAGAGRFATAEG